MLELRFGTNGSTILTFFANFALTELPDFLQLRLDSLSNFLQEGRIGTKEIQVDPSKSYLLFVNFGCFKVH